MAEKESKNKWHTPAERIMMLGFAAVILLGTILLYLPVSAADGKSVYWLPPPLFPHPRRKNSRQPL